MAERGTPDQNSSQAPFIQALVQKPVTAITNPVGRLSFRMLRESCRAAQGVGTKKLALRLLQKTSPQSHRETVFKVLSFDR
jgi:hypothetical protein